MPAMSQALSAGLAAQYLQAARHAQTGEHGRAEEEFHRVLAERPDFAPARFQLGLLLLCQERVDEALTAWAPLEKLSENDPYLHFKRGLEMLCRDEFEASRESIRRGISLNDLNGPLNADMQGLLNAIPPFRSPEGSSP
jgi:tetratricopeptide (TPR) repeat protein